MHSFACRRAISQQLLGAPASPSIILDPGATSLASRNRPLATRCLALASRNVAPFAMDNLTLGLDLALASPNEAFAQTASSPLPPVTNPWPAAA